MLTKGEVNELVNYNKKRAGTEIHVREHTRFVKNRAPEELLRIKHWLKIENFISGISETYDSADRLKMMKLQKLLKDITKRKH